MPVKFKLLPGKSHTSAASIKDLCPVTHSLTLCTNTTSEHHPQFLILHSSPSQPSKSLLVGERALAVAASWSLGQSPQSLSMISHSRGSHCCILTRSWSRRSLCLVLSEVRVPRIYCSGGRRSLTSGHPWVTVLLAVIVPRSQ